MRSVVACLRPDHPAACPFAADSSEPDRPQAVKAGAVAPPLRGFGLDSLRPPRFGLSKQTKADWGRTALPIRTAMPAPTMCLATAAQRPRCGPQGSESRVLTGLRERMMTPEIAVDTMRLYTENQLAQPPSVEAHRNSPAASLPKPLLPSRRSCASSARRLASRPVRPADRL